MVMLWVLLVFIIVLGVAFPASAWWLASRKASARPPYSRAAGTLSALAWTLSMRGSPITPDSRP